MKGIFIVYNIAIDEEVTGALEELGIDAYTKWHQVLGRGHTSEPHLNTDVWPGLNMVAFLAIDDGLAPQVLEAVRNLRTSKLAREGIKAFQFALEEIT